jgi:hypothetical protein
MQGPRRNAQSLSDRPNAVVVPVALPVLDRLLLKTWRVPPALAAATMILAVRRLPKANNLLVPQVQVLLVRRTLD